MDVGPAEVMAAEWYEDFLGVWVGKAASGKFCVPASEDVGLWKSDLKELYRLAELPGFRGAYGGELVRTTMHFGADPIVTGRLITIFPSSMVGPQSLSFWMRCSVEIVGHPTTGFRVRVDRNPQDSRLPANSRRAPDNALHS